MLVRRHLVAHGHVQGVFFREGVRQRAEREGVTGWVQNRPDGTLEAVFEGEPSAVQRLVDFCGTGPDGARVDGVQVRDEEPQHAGRFEVR